MQVFNQTHRVGVDLLNDISCKEGGENSTSS